MAAIKQTRAIIFVLVVFFIAQIICSSLKSDTNAEWKIISHHCSVMPE